MKWRFHMASVRGSLHEQKNQVCQDRHYCRLPEPDLLVVAIADGAGSAKKSEIGAAIASRTAVETLCPDGSSPLLLPDLDALTTILKAALVAARYAVINEARQNNVRPRELATTLILLVATPELVAAAQIGDGATVVCSRDGKIFPLTRPQVGEYINETYFLTSDGTIEQAQFSLWEGEVAKVAAFSDGLQLQVLSLADGAPHEPFFAPSFKFIEDATDPERAQQELVNFLVSERVRKHTDDDLTLLLGALVE